MSEFEPVLAVSGLNGSNGFTLLGEATRDYAGISVSSAGDIDSDGLADLIVGATGASGTTPFSGGSGAAYVVFGASGGFARRLELSSLDGDNGFQIVGALGEDQAGGSVSSAGDVNGDGLADVIVGASRASPNGRYSGSSHVVFGAREGFRANVELSSLDGANGFALHGEAAEDYSGYRVAAAGDINGDGFGDVLVGTLIANSAYVVFGGAGGFAAGMDLASLDGTNGFRIDGKAAGDRLGGSVASAGDLNGDGLDDFVVGATGADPSGPSSGAAYVVFGRTTGFGATLRLSSLNGAAGFQITGESQHDSAGASVANAGDVDADGLNDLLITAAGADQYSQGKAYLIYGKAGGVTPNLRLASLDGTNGIEIVVERTYDLILSASSAGDVNGDGFDDLVIDSIRVPINDDPQTRLAYVVFGRSGGLPPVVNLSSIDGTNGFIIAGAGSAGSGGPAWAGDVNGDGFGDLIIGSHQAPSHGTDSGVSYVVFGHRADAAVLRAGSAIGNRINGGRGQDTISGLAGNDVLIGWEGGDVLDGGLGNDSINAGAGNDTILASLGHDVINGGPGRDSLSFALPGARQVVASLFDGGYHYRSGQGEASAGRIAGIENLIGSSRGDRLVGDAAANALSGAAGNDTLVGGAGDDTLDGGLGVDWLTGGFGDDVYIVDSQADLVGREISRGGNDTIQAAISYRLSFLDEIENVILTGTAPVNAEGDGFANRLVGNSADNMLSGGGGRDTMIGGLGNDTFLVDRAGDVVIEGTNDGASDKVISLVDYVLPGTVENLEVLGTAVRGTGNAGNNIIDGDDAGDFDARFNVLVGLDGNDTIDGGDGADRLIGGAGNDTYRDLNGGDRIIELAGEGIDTIFTGVNYTLPDNIENLVLRSNFSLIGIGRGNELNNLLIGNEDWNILNGLAGADTMIGGADGDTYIVDNAGDVVREGEGGVQVHDIVQSSVSYRLGANLEALTLTGTAAIDGVGNSRDNRLTGNAAGNRLDGLVGNDRLDGGGGADLMIGGRGDDIYCVNTAGDRIVEKRGQGSDVIVSTITIRLGVHFEEAILDGEAAIDATGNASDNELSGNDGNNILDGREGNDSLEGHRGQDVYRFTTALDPAANVDTIESFYDDDRIELDDAVFAGLALGGLGAEAFVVGAVAADADDRIVYDTATGALSFDPDGSGTAAAQHFATLTFILAPSFSHLTFEVI